MNRPNPNTYNGDPTITAEFFRRRRAVRSGSVLGDLSDPETLAAALVDELGPMKARTVAWRLLELARESA